MRAEEHFERARDARGAGDLGGALAAIRRAIAGFTRQGPDSAGDAANARIEHAAILLERGRAALSDKELGRAEALLAGHHGEAATTLRARLSLLRARVRRELGRYTEAMAEGRTALRLGGHLGGMFLAQVHNELGVIGKFSGWFAMAEGHYRAAMPLVRALHGPRSREMAVLWHNLGGLAHARGDFAKGEPLARRAIDLLPPGDPERLEHEVAHAALLDGLGRHEEAIAVYRRALRAYRRRFGREHVEIALALHNLAASEDALGRHGLARRHYAQALAMQRRVLGVSHPLRLLTARNLASLQARTKS